MFLFWLLPQTNFSRYVVTEFEIGYQNLFFFYFQVINK